MMAEYGYTRERHVETSCERIAFVEWRALQIIKISCCLCAMAECALLHVEKKCPSGETANKQVVENGLKKENLGADRINLLRSGRCACST